MDASDFRAVGGPADSAGLSGDKEGPKHYTPKTAFLELGSTTIKFYLLDLTGDAAGQVTREIKIPWELGYDVFQHQRISPTTVSRCLGTLEDLQRQFPEIPFQTVTAVGTAALREAQNIEVFKRLLLEKLRIRIRTIEGGIEAFLLETAFRDSVETYPTAIFDLGGGSLEFVEYLSPSSTRKTSVPPAALLLPCRLPHTRAPRPHLPDRRRIAHETLREHLAQPPVAYQSLIGTAGTIRAIVTLLERDRFDATDLNRLLQREVHGPVWNELEPHRRKVFLPGLIVAESLFRIFRLRHVEYRTASVKQGLVSLTSMLPAVGRGT